MFDRLLSGSCDETRESLSDHLEGELRGLRRRRVLRHLSGCDRCREVLRTLMHTIDQLHSVGRDADPPASVVDAVLARVRYENG
jgi:predicted anti-sigma-YlaC factor YlaD